MSVTILSTPFTFGWAGNRNSYELRCNYLDTTGTAASMLIHRSGSLPAVGRHVVVAVDGTEYTFTVVSESSLNTYEVATVTELFQKIRNCYYMQQLFEMPIVSGDSDGSRYLSLVGKDVGYHKVEIYCTDENGNVTDDADSMINWVYGEGGAGIDTAYKPNYSLSALLEVVVNNGNSLTTHTIGPLSLQPGSDNCVSVRTEALKGLFPQPDMPSVSAGLNTWGILTNAIVKYRLKFGEMWGEDVPLMQNWQSHDWKFGICGEVAERFARVDLPDWDWVDRQINGNPGIFWIIGEDGGCMRRVRRSQAEYIYGFWYDAGEAASATRTVTFSVDGAGVSTSVEHEAVNGTIYRIPVGPLALGTSAGPSYDVALSCGDYTWRRSFVVIPDAFGQHEFVLQNKYGLLQSVVIPEVQRELTTEVEELSVDKRRYLNVSASDVYTARTDYISKDEARRIAQCLDKEYHYMKNGEAWLRITIEAGSFTVFDEANDMVRMEWKYRFVENQAENVVNGSLARTIGNNVLDDMEEILSYTSATEATSNIIMS